MIRKQDFQRLSPVIWEIPVGFVPEMNVPVRVFADETILENALKDRSLEQAVNAATLPGLVSHVAVMPDVHQGYGFPIGGVAATDAKSGVISPGGIGYDINCGVRLLSSRIPYEEAVNFLEDLSIILDQECPSGVGVGGRIKLTDKELDQICREGARWARKHGYADADDIEATEDAGGIPGADPKFISSRAKKRGRGQMGTLGAGNHFIEVDVVCEIYHEEAARRMGLAEGMLALQIHCGSRGFGHQVCSDYVREFQPLPQKFGIKLPDRELVCAPLDSEPGQAYLAAMTAAANYAFCNRQVLTALARRAFEQVLAGKVDDWYLRQVYDLAHNVGKIETHVFEGVERELCVHRKGATRAFGAYAPGLSARYRSLGQPVLVPGSMGTSSWVLLGKQESMALTLGSCCHGAGRLLSRKKARQAVRGAQLHRDLLARGIHIRAGSMAGLAEEAPQAYKDVDRVVQVVADAGIAAKVARLEPLVVIKG